MPVEKLPEGRRPKAPKFHRSQIERRCVNLCHPEDLLPRPFSTWLPHWVSWHRLHGAASKPCSGHSPQSPSQPREFFSESLSSKTSLSTAFQDGLRFVLTAGTPGIFMPIRLLVRYGSAERDQLKFLHGAPHAHTQAAWFSWRPATITSNAPAITVVSK